MSTVFCWGATHDGQLGLGGLDAECFSTATENNDLKGRVIQSIGCGLEHTVFVMKDGSVKTCGNNDSGQLGHDKSQKKPELVHTLEAQTVQHVACGAEHNIITTDSGQLFSWGNNKYSQLGLSTTEEHIRVPKLIKSLSSYSVVQVSCGYYHTMVLTRDSQVLTWGQNNYGQLGQGHPEPLSGTPKVITSLQGLPVAFINSGGYHSFVLTLSGALFGWGKNNFGQLGVGNEKNHIFPVLCKSLRDHRVQYLSCGEDHTAVLTEEGGVFTFGAGMYGQLGHNSTNNEILPKKVFELMGSVVTQVACGRKHTLAFVPSRGRIYSFGIGGKGQLGIGNTNSRNSPSTVIGPWVPANKESHPNSAIHAEVGQKYVIQQIYSGGDHCFVCGQEEAVAQDPVDDRIIPAHKQILTLTQGRIERYVSLPANQRPSQELQEEVETIFSSAACLNGSFLVANNEHFGCSRKNPGLDLDAATEAFNQLKETKNAVIMQLISSSLEQKLLHNLPNSPPDMEALRLYILLPYCHILDNPDRYSIIIAAFGNSLMTLQPAPSKVIDIWWSKLKSREFSRLVKIYKQYVVFILHQPNATNDFEVLMRQRGLFVSMELLKKLNVINENNNQIIPYHKFYISELKDKVDIRADYINWIQQTKYQQGGGMLSFCNYPFVFDAPAKTMLLHTDAVMQMQCAVDEVQRRNFTSFFVPTIDPVNPCLVLYVSREHIVQDTINQLAKQKNTDFKKPLKVIIKGEEAIDAGGVRKEFFILLLREILDPKYGMFRYFEESRLIWFNDKTFEDRVMFYLIGVLCGLAIYNNTIVDINFPLALYKKLLNRPVTMDDLCEIMPDVARNLQKLLDYDEGDVEDDFYLSFEIVRDNFGEPEHIDLIPNGASVNVTADNRQLYVDAYLNFFFNTSVSVQFVAFAEGFHRVCGGRVLELFHPAELQAMVVGNENYDWEQLEKTAEYKGEYYPGHRTIRWFWEVFHSLPVSGKKKFLLFLTGSDRIPILGMNAVKIFIQSTGGGDTFLPVAHTCFNLLDLPKYTRKEILQEKLLLAIDHAQGFGLV